MRTVALHDQDADVLELLKSGMAKNFAGVDRASDEDAIRFALRLALQTLTAIQVVRDGKGTLSGKSA